MPTAKKKTVKKKSVKKKKDERGRPTKFREEFCEQLVAHMAEGLSFESFGASPRGVCKQTLYTWLEKHPTFVDAKSRGKLESLLFWEKIGIKGTLGKVSNFSASSYIFNMKNRFKWADRHEHSVDQDKNEIKLKYDPKA